MESTNFSKFLTLVSSNGTRSLVFTDDVTAERSSWMKVNTALLSAQNQLNATRLIRQCCTHANGQWPKAYCKKQSYPHIASMFSEQYSDSVSVVETVLISLYNQTALLSSQFSLSKYIRWRLDLFLQECVCVWWIKHMMGYCIQQQFCPSRPLIKYGSSLLGVRYCCWTLPSDQRNPSPQCFFI